MRRTVLWAGLLALAGLIGCGLHSAPPRAGDVVVPEVNGKVHWTAGSTGQLSVRLVAHGPDGSAPRSLGFAGLPGDANPSATVTFYKGEQTLSPVSVTLDHRCWGGLYQISGSGIDVPAGATRATVVITADVRLPGVRHREVTQTVDIRQ